MPRYRSTIVSVSLLALALAGCNKSAQDMTATSASGGLPPLPAALPMQAGPASQLVTAPPVSALPVGRYVGVSRPASERDRYAYLDRASDVEDEIGDAPPDYDYDDGDGVSPYVWETNGGDYRYAEPSDDGYRDYYYQPGADTPYLVRTRDYSYAYAGGALVAIYMLNGALVPPDQYGGYRDQASRYYSRGEQLRHAADQRQHQGVIAANWAAQRPQFSTQQASWANARSQQPEWQAYHAQNDPSQQPGWQQEHQQRQQVAQQFAGWQSHGLAGAPPAVLAAAGPRAAQQMGTTPAAGRSPVSGQTVLANRSTIPASPGFAGSQQPHRRDMPAPSGVAPVPARLAGPAPAPMIKPVPHNAAPAAAAHEQQLAAQRAAQQQGLANQQKLLANQRLAQEAGRAQQEAAAQRQAAAARQQQLTARSEAQQQALAGRKAELETSRARQQAAAQQQIANVHRQQDMAAQEQVAARQQTQQREALVAAHQAQLHAMVAQRQAEVARAQVPHAEPAHPAPGHENDRHEP